jgi:PhoPQ-activated pathogenicity-related protein
VLEEKTEDPFGLAVTYRLRLDSQVWQDIPWKHDLLVFQPKGVAPVETMLLLVTGGKPSKGAIAYGTLLAAKIKAPCAAIFQIPNQPLFDGKKEDALIAETFVRYLNTKDENWPLLFPMTKSVVKAMDALQAFSEREWQKPVKHFVVTGGSKRGWTTWLSAVADARVKAIAPMVIDMLNLSKQLPHQLDCFGAYSAEIHDYTTRGLVPIPDTPEAKRLWQMVDPYSYRDRLTLPKFIVLGNNDPYWTVDALNLYWGGLGGEKWILYVPNAGHKLQQQTDSNGKNPMRAIEGVAAFVRHQITGVPLPKLSWKHETVEGKLRLVVQASPAPLSSRLWEARAPTRDFRHSQWSEQPVSTKSVAIVGELAPPTEGYLAYYADLEYAIEGLHYHLCTQLRVAGGNGILPKNAQ